MNDLDDDFPTDDEEIPEAGAAAKAKKKAATPEAYDRHYGDFFDAKPILRPPPRRGAT